MLTNILMVLIGMMIWQLLIFILTLNGDLDASSDTILSFCCGIPLILVAIPFAIIKPFRKSYIKSNYNGYRLYPKSLRGGLFSTLYMKPKTAQKFNFNEEKEYYIKLASEGKDWKSLPHKEEMIKGNFAKNVQKYDLEKWLKSDN
jgi:hypothetical protein